MYRCSFRRVHFWIWFNFGEMQSVLPSPKKTKCAATPPSGEEARAGPSRHRCCSSVCRGPPSPATKHVGRPTRQEAWVERVQRALRADGREELSAFIKESKKKTSMTAFGESQKRVHADFLHVRTSPALRFVVEIWMMLPSVFSHFENALCHVASQRAVHSADVGIGSSAR